MIILWGQSFYLIFIILYWTTAYPKFNLFLPGLKLPFAVIFLLISMLFGFLNLPSSVKRLRLIAPYLFAAVYFELGIVISNIGHPSGIKSILELSLYLMIPLTVFLLSDGDNSFVKRHMIGFWINGNIMAIIGLYRLFTGAARWVEIVNHEKVGFGSRNLDAFFVMLGMVCGLILINYTKKAFAKAVFLIMAIISFIAVFLSLSRGMLLTSMLSLIPLFKFLNWKTRFAVFAFGGFLLISAAVGVLSTKEGARVGDIAIERFSMLAEPDVKQKGAVRSSLPGRLQLIPLSFKAVKENPVTGLGFGNFKKYAARNRLHVNDPHNNYLLIWTELGSITFMGYLWMTLLPVFIYRRVRKFTDDKVVRIPYMLICFVVIFTSFFTNYVTYFGYWVAYAAVFPGYAFIYEQQRLKSSTRA